MDAAVPQTPYPKYTPENVNSLIAELAASRRKVTVCPSFATFFDHATTTPPNAGRGGYSLVLGLGGTKELRVLRLDRERQASLLTNFFGGDRPRARRVLEVVDAQPVSLQQLVTIPLYLALLSKTAAQSEEELGHRLRKFQLRHMFLYEAMSFLLTNKHRGRNPGECAVQDEVRRQIVPLAALAFSVLCDGDLEPPRATIEEKLKEIDAEQSGSMLDAFAKSEILRPVNRAEPQGRWVFQHRSFLEALAARHLAAADERGNLVDLRKERKKVAVAAYKKKPARQRLREVGADLDSSRESFWSESFAMAAGNMGKDAREWIEWLVSARDLAPCSLSAFAIAEKDQLPPSLLHDVLWRNRDLYWEDKMPLYEQLAPPFRLAAKPEFLAQLLRYVEHERSGCRYWRIDRRELWCIDFLLASVAENETTDGATREHVEAARAKLMWSVGVWKVPSKIIAMLAVLPNSIEESRQKGTYWRYVPEGYGWTGGRGDGDCSNHEPPRVPVHVKEPFWMAEIHVTEALWRLFSGEATTCWLRNARRLQPMQIPRWLRWTAEISPFNLRRQLPATITWWEATAFARWLTVHLRPVLGWDFEIRLPREWEWDYCARFRRQSTTCELELERAETSEYGWAQTASEPMAITSDNIDVMYGKVYGAVEFRECGDMARPANPLGVRDLVRFQSTWCSNSYPPCAPKSSSSLDPVEPPVVTSTMIGLRAERATRNNDRLNWQHAPPYLYKGCRLVCVRDLSRPNPGARPVGSSRGRRPRAVAVMAQLASRSFTCLWSEWWREGGVLRRWLVTLTLLALALIAWDISTSETTVTTLSGRVRYGSFVVSLPKTFVLYEESSAPRRMLGVRPTAWYGTLGETWRVEIGWDSLPRGLEGVEGREAAISLLARARIPGTLKDYEYYWESGANMDCLCAVLKPSENFVFRAFGYAVGKGDYLWIRVVSPAGDVNLDAKAILVGIVKETKVRLQ